MVEILNRHRTMRYWKYIFRRCCL